MVWYVGAPPVRIKGVVMPFKMKALLITIWMWVWVIVLLFGGAMFTWYILHNYDEVIMNAGKVCKYIAQLFMEGYNG